MLLRDFDDVGGAGDASLLGQFGLESDLPCCLNICVGSARSVYIYSSVHDRMYGDVPAKNTACTYMQCMSVYGPGQPY